MSTANAGKPARIAAEAAFLEFDRLPSAANVRAPVVARLFGVSTPTIWRWARDKDGPLPSPSRRGGVTAWNVGELRAALYVVREGAQC